MKKVPLAIAATALLSLCVFADQARLKNGDQSRGDIIRSDGIRTLTFAQSDEIAKHLGLENHSSLTDSKIASGLREALQVGANDAVKLTSKRDGYFGNDAIKILMPDNLHTVEKGLRALGYGPNVDGFILSRNRAAEAAEPSAKKIFVDAILSMSFDDAWEILYCGNGLFQK